MQRLPRFILLPLLFVSPFTNLFETWADSGANAKLHNTKLTVPSATEAARMYRWQRRRPEYESLAQRIAPPQGFARIGAKLRSFGYWLRHLPLLTKDAPVRSYKSVTIVPNGDPRVAAVVDLDLSQRNRQQCADTVMRLRGEYLYSSGQPQRARFFWAGGKRFGFGPWTRGIRPVKQGRKWKFAQRARATRGYRAFRRYLSYMFAWTGTMHLAGEKRVLRATTDAKVIQIGDFFIQGGSPGHAVIVLDIARNGIGKTKALLGQGFMPAQDLHVLRPPGQPTARNHASAWFDLDPAKKTVSTPFWRPFRYSELRRF